MPRPRRKNVKYSQEKQEANSNSDSDFEVNTSSKKAVKHVMRDSDSGEDEESVDEDSDYEIDESKQPSDDDDDDEDNGDQEEVDYDDEDDASDLVVSKKPRAGKSKSGKGSSDTVVTYGNKIGVQTGMICRPNLSDEDTSSSSDDEVPISKPNNTGNTKDTANKLNDIDKSKETFPVASMLDKSILEKHEVGGGENDSKTVTLPRKEVTSVAQEMKKEVNIDREPVDDVNSLEVVSSSVNMEAKNSNSYLVKSSVTGEENISKSKRKLSVTKETGEKKGSENTTLKDLSETQQGHLKRVKSHEETDGPHKKKKQKKHNLVKAETFSSGDESMEDWEDVDEVNVKLPTKKKKIKKEEDTKPIEIKDVQISVGVQSIHKKKKSKEEKMFLWLRQLFGRIQRQQQLLIHKCHLLCLLTRALQQNTLCNADILKGLCLSLIPSNFHKTSPSQWNITDLRQFLSWFQKEIPTVGELLLYIDKNASKMQYFSRVHVFVIMLRSLGFTTRLVVSLQPCPSKIKPPDSSEISTETTEEKNNLKRKLPMDPSTSTKSKKSSSREERTKNVEEILSGEPGVNKSPYFNQSSSNVGLQGRKGGNNKKKNDYLDETTGECKFVVSALKLVPKEHKSRRVVKKITYTQDHSSGNESANDNGDDDDDDFDDSLNSKTAKKQHASKTPKRSKKSQKGDEDDDFDIFAEYKRLLRGNTPSENSPSTKKPSKIKPDNTVTRTKKIPKKASSQQPAAPTPIDLWIEVYIMTMQKWITVELTAESINDPSKCESVATKPLQYILGIDNDQRIKDITCRYASKWLSFNRKLRTDREWWAHTLHPYKPKDDVRDRAEEGQLKKALIQQDFPKSISEFKDNPLYALKRHLLKYQAIYPETAVPLGYIRNEAIYSRDCVHELHTRDTWRKRGRTVEGGEAPYKIVKGRPKRNTPLPERDNLKVEVFGLWQTEIYVPPPVVDGKVPKNEYGNVELFQPSMLPAGAIHLPMNNMQKIAKKLNIDYAPAMMGWDFHGGWSHPVIEGIVAAKEYEDVLLDAWRQQEEEDERKEKEKREKMIYGRWKALVKALLIRDKLRNKYDFQDELNSSSVNSKKTENDKEDKKSATMETVTTETNEPKNDEYSNMSVSWPMNRMQGTTTLDSDGHVHIFPEENYLTDPDTNFITKVCECGLKIPLDNIEKL